MIKNLGLLAKRPDVSVEYFHWHWRAVHGPLALRITAIRRYVQHHRLRDRVDGFPRLPQEGVAEVWVDDVPSAAGLSHNPEFTAHAGPDEANFMNRSASLGLKCEEQVLLAGPPIPADDPGVSVLLFLHPPGSGDDDFPDHLEVTVRDAAVDLPGLRRLCVARPIAELPRNAPYAAVVELGFPGIAAFDRGWASPGGAALRRSLAELADLDRSAGTVGEEYRLVWD